jgi:predicted RNA-binding protein with PUA-like domain
MTREKPKIKAKPAAKPAKKASKPKAAPKPVVSTGFWLMKSEPDVFGWDDLVKRGKAGEPWTGVRNYQARNNMRAMQVGDLAFFYHSNIGKEIAGVMRVVAPAHPDQTDDTGAWECVDVEAVMPLKTPLTLETIKADPKLSSMALVNNSRLSVQPVTAPEWAHLCKLAGIDAKALKK